MYVKLQKTLNCMNTRPCFYHSRRNRPLTGMRRLKRYLLYPLAVALFFSARTGLAADNVHRMQRDGHQLETTISGQLSPATQDKLLAWVDHIATAMGQVFGHWPRQHWAISITPASGSANDPIPWAMVHRGEVDRVEFFTVTTVSLEELKQAWTGYHELSHLLIPYRGWGDAWFSEGLASYYQNILQARSGVITEQQMWQKLYDGFQRGLAETEFDGQPLAAVSAGMRETGAFMRVYWSGAWYFLAADTRLRLQSGGRDSLDNALAALNDCCADQQLSVIQIVKKLDQLKRLVLFETLYEQAAGSTRVPDFEPIFASLGIDIVDGQVRLQQTGPGARLRRGIASAPSL